MASSPGFDPNIYLEQDYNWNSPLSRRSSIRKTRRSSTGQPKASTRSARSSSSSPCRPPWRAAGSHKNSTYDCGYDFTELIGITLHDWTWDHFQEDGKTQPSGLLTLPQGLIKLLQPLVLAYRHRPVQLPGYTTLNSEMARSFGLGSKTGIEGIDEQPGYVPDPTSPLDATNLAIGEGDLQVTPLQVARFVAAARQWGRPLPPTADREDRRPRRNEQLGL